MIQVQKNELGGRLARRLENQVSSFGEEFMGGLKECIQKRPVESAITAFAGGLLLGRFRVRPVEALIISALIGLGGGLLISRSNARSNSGNHRRAR